MRRRFVPLLLAAAVSALIAAVPQIAVPLIVHEWGTFTSVAGADGQAVRWLPQSGPQDLPCFVERNQIEFKGALAGTVRMETPVLYFYAPQPIDARVDVRFPQGYMSEWYPRGIVTSGVPTANGQNFTIGGGLLWPSVRVAPGAPDVFPREAGPSHYYAARETGAAPVRVGDQSEKFLFYRGVGQFQPPLAAVARQDGSVALRSMGGAAIGDAIYFENRRGAATFTARHIAAPEGTLPRPSLDDASGPPLAELKKILVAQGLYEREAQAMVDTWKDSWFEEGARLLYIVPARSVDEILPLTISPRPSVLTRVFVGRIELVTPATIRDVKAAIASDDRAMLAKYGRFLQPIVERAGLALPARIGPAVATPACR
jgi:hypothetical protein